MVDKEEFKQFILNGCTIPQLQELYGLSRSKIAQLKRDFGFVGLTPNSKKLDREIGQKSCNICNKILDLGNFYSNGISTTGLIRYKPACISCENTKRKHNYTDKIIAYLGSIHKKYECETCGYTGIWGSLDFHHTNPKDKLFNIGNTNNQTISDEQFNKTVVPELNKCRLLCPNCHRQEHLLMGWN